MLQYVCVSVCVLYAKVVSPSLIPFLVYLSLSFALFLCVFVCDLFYFILCECVFYSNSNGCMIGLLGICQVVTLSFIV